MSTDTTRLAARIEQLILQGKHELASELALQMIALTPESAPAAVAPAQAGAAPAPAAGESDTWSFTEMRAWTPAQMEDARENHADKLDRSMKSLGRPTEAAA